MLIHPLAERLRGLGMAAMAGAFLEMQTNSAAAELSREDWLGLLIDREATATTSVSADGSVRPGCVRPRWWKTPTSVHRAVWTVPCSTNSLAVTGSVIASTW